MNPPEKKGVPTSPDEWLKHAVSDLKFAQLGKNEKDILPQQICFHAQQAVEKTIKAVLLFCKIDFPLTHDIEELVDLLTNAGISLPQDIREVGILTPYAVETRYPGYWGEITEHDIDEAIHLAEKAIIWAKNVISNKSINY